MSDDFQQRGGSPWGTPPGGGSGNGSGRGPTPPDVEKIIIDSKRLFKKTQKYLEDISPSLLERLELYKLKSPLFESFGIESEIEKLLRPKNLFEPSPGKGFNIYETKDNIKIGVLNLMGNVFMKKCDDVFEISEKFMKQHKLKQDYDLLIVDFHGEITSEKNAIGHFFDGNATLVVGTHTHVPTNDARILSGGTGYQTDAGMCGDYNSVIGMNTENSLNRFLKKDSIKHFPAVGDATLCGVIVDCNIETGLASNIESYIYGDQLKNT